MLYMLCVMTAVLMGESCSRNNGDIGVWFGLWKVESIEVDGEPAADYDGNVFFQFQGKVFNMRKITEHHVYTDCFGNWEEKGETLKLTFPDDRYVPFSETRMGAECTLSIEKKSGSEIEMSFVQDGTGSIVRLRLVKWV